MPVNFNPFVEQRRLHKLKLLDMIQKNKGMEREQLIALFSLQTGLKRQTVKEYIDELEEAGILQNGGRDDSKAGD